MSLRVLFASAHLTSFMIAAFFCICYQVRGSIYGRMRAICLRLFVAMSCGWLVGPRSSPSPEITIQAAKSLATSRAVTFTPLAKICSNLTRNTTHSKIYLICDSDQAESFSYHALMKPPAITDKHTGAKCIASLSNIITSVSAQVECSSRPTRT